ncbi:PRC-barrel domain-containing protein [Maritalea mediterranea]|uniref:PRC-barrel domain-containing protein n=1 Tax=Maritalea mediterranea TaxID=2909667 RepID=A0ABS9E8H8_9HYPH|nr:PRC-barrel domain-containing protein [Maritalea mediterranea]MCF4099184.1 PRC-barrel domain-containing protein [Maritalea mediterranea]
MKKLLATTAIATLISAPAFADGANVSADTSTTVNTTVEASSNDSTSNAEAGADANTSVDAGVDLSGDADASVELNANAETASLSVDMSGALLASELLGTKVHTAAGTNVEVVGEVKDIVMDDDGNAQYVIVGVGGFLGIGEKEVALSADQIGWAQVNNEKIVVTQKTKADLEAAAEFDRAEFEENDAYTAANLSWTAEGAARLKAAMKQ